MAQKKAITGIVISDENAKPIALANILQMNAQKRYLTNRKGIFNLPEAPTDSFRFTCVGYEPLTIKGIDMINLNADTILILLRTINYRLKDVTITYSNRKRDSIARMVADMVKYDALLNNNRRITNRPRGQGLEGVLLEIYYEYSKEGKDMFHFDDFVKTYRSQQTSDKRYNKEFIKRTTGLPDDYLDAFILFCRLDRNFILQASDYDFICAIKDCETKFRAINQINTD